VARRSSWWPIRALADRAWRGSVLPLAESKLTQAV
jgi:hypothetical protein